MPDIRQMPSNIKAFPTAWGGAKDSVGGRGGIVYHVENLNSSGSGSLANGLLLTTPRTIVFDVSGNINIPNFLELIAENDNVTIAGETAPQGGITITTEGIQFGGGFNRSNQGVDNVIMRHIRFRLITRKSNPPPSGYYDESALIITGGNNLMFDHISMSFSGDQHISMNTQVDNVINLTFQNCLFGQVVEGAAILGVDDTSFIANNISWLRNLAVHVDHRLPNIGETGRFDVINNVVHNWNTMIINNNNEDPDINHINNWYREGSFTRTSPSRDNYIQAHDETPQIYTSGNYNLVHYPTPQDNDWLLWRQTPDVAATSEKFTTTKHTPIDSTYEELTALEAYDYAVANAGANVYVSDTGVRGTYYDSQDTQLISDIENNISRDTQDYSWTLPIIPSNNRSVGFYNSTKSNNIPEFFWDEHNITSDTEVKSSYIFDGIVVPNTAGYTAFEMWLIYAAQDDLKFPLSNVDQSTIGLTRRKKAASSLFINT